jgi:hypothetical protein
MGIIVVQNRFSDRNSRDKFVTLYVLYISIAFLKVDIPYSVKRLRGLLTPSQPVITRRNRMPASNVTSITKPASPVFGGPAQASQNLLTAFSKALSFHQRNLETFCDVVKNLATVWPDYVGPQIQKRVPAAMTANTEESLKVFSAFLGGSGIDSALRSFYENAIEQGQLNIQAILGEMISSQPVKDSNDAVSKRVKDAFIEEIGEAMILARNAFDGSKIS